MMKFNIVPESCRVCLRKCKKSHSIYAYFEEGEETPCKMLELITGLDLESEQLEKNSPQAICRRCELSLNMAFEFRNRALKSQKIIENYNKKFNQPSYTVHSKTEETDELSEYTEDDDPYDDYEALEMEECDNKSSVEMVFKTKLEIESVVHQTENDSDSEIMDEIFLDTVEEPHSFKGTIHLSEENDDPISVDSLNSTTQDFDIYLHDEEQQGEEEPYNNSKTPANPTEKVDNELEFQQIDYEGEYEHENKFKKKLTGKENKNSAKSERKPRDDRHVCDICGNTYAHRGRMLEHRRRHDRNLTYECEICGKSFNLRENMRKHTLTHRGSKPYKCSFCSRTFYYESVKKSHEAVHTGLKPYVCKKCNKAFAYAHALKKHEMIHNEVKLFHCIYCNKDFRLQHHMKQHEQTKLHQTAVTAAQSKGLKDSDHEEDAETQVINQEKAEIEEKDAIIS